MGDAEDKIPIGASTELHNGVPLNNTITLYETVWNYRYSGI
jgi:hypothetical protein